MKKRKRKGRILKNFAEPLRGEDLRAFAEVINRMYDESGNELSFAQHAIATAEVFGDDDEVLMSHVSLELRTQALVQFIHEEELPGWTRRENDEGFTEAHPALLHAAATEPIRARKNELGGADLTFEKESFLKAVFRHAKRSDDVQREFV